MNTWMRAYCTALGVEQERELPFGVRVKERGRWEQGRAVRVGYRRTAEGREPAVVVDGLGRFANESFAYGFAQLHPADRPAVEAAWQRWHETKLAEKAQGEAR